MIDIEFDSVSISQAEDEGICPTTVPALDVIPGGRDYNRRLRRGAIRTRDGRVDVENKDATEFVRILLGGWTKMHVHV